MKTKQAGRRAAAAPTGSLLVALLILAGTAAPRSCAQTQTGPVVQSAKVNEGTRPASAQPARDAAPPDKSTNDVKAADVSKRIADNEALAKELEAMKLRIEQLEAELKARTATEQLAGGGAADIVRPGPSAPVAATTSSAAPAIAGAAGSLAANPSSLPIPASGQSSDAAPAKKEKIAPFPTGTGPG